MIAVGALLDRLRRSTFVQAVRQAHVWAWLNGSEAELGRDAPPAAEPTRLSASDRMHMPVTDVARSDHWSEGPENARANPAGAQDKRLSIVSNVMGFAGATPALPQAYSELQLQRRRARDFAFSHFLALFDHRTLSFFWRISEKYSWPLMAERGARQKAAGTGTQDDIQRALITLAGVASDGARHRLDVPDAALVTLVGHLADARRSAASVQTVLQVLTGLPLRLIEGTPTWMAVPLSEQTRIGGPLAGFARLGEGPGAEGAGASAAAMIGSSVLDAQHHFVVEVGPLSWSRVQEFCCQPGNRRKIAQVCALAAGIEQRPSLRLLVATDVIPELRLGASDEPAMLGWTTWLGSPVRPNGIADDCLIPIDSAALSRG